tara:strand:- start:2285 stop:3844 length:1560 start_codon:yes stop_codon:yes gene_type:complete
MAGDPLLMTDLAYRGNVAAGVGFNNPGTGDGRLVLPIWAGEVIHAYDQYNIFEPLVESRTITSGTTMEFPVTGYVSLKPTWNAGEELVGNQDSTATTFRINLDKRPIATHFELDNIDLMLTQWEYRSELARQAGRTLSDARDRQIGAFIARAAAEDGLANDPRATDQHGYSAVGGLGGKVFCNDKFNHLGRSGSTAAQRTDAALKLLEKIEEFQIRLQEVDAPTEGVFCAVTPRAFQDIRALGVARDNSDLAGGAGRPFFGGVADAGGLGAGLGQGMFNLADRLEYQGVSIIKTNHLPNQNYGVTAQKIGEARYNRSFNVMPVKALIWQQACVASLKMQGLKVDQVDDVRRNTVFTVASMMGGTGVMKPEHAAVCVGAPNQDVTFTASNNRPVYAANQALGAASAANVTFGAFVFDGTTGDISTYKTGTAAAGNSNGAAGTATAGDVSASKDATDDALMRDAYQASLSAYALNGADDASAEAMVNDGVFVAEYTTAPDAAIYAADSASPGIDGLGTAAS